MITGYSKGQSDNLPAVDAVMVADYMSKNTHFVGAEIRGMKAARAGRESYGDNALGYVQVKRERHMCTVKAKVTPEHRVRSSCYRVTAVINEGESSVLEVKCEDCAASAGGCKHAVAFLFWLHRRSEEPSCTSTVCYWKKSKLSSIGTTKKIITAEEMGKPRQHDCIPEEERQQFFHSVVDSLKSSHPNCQLVRSISSQNNDLSLHTLLVGFHYSSHSLTAHDFIQYCGMNMAGEDLMAVEKETMEQGTSGTWHSLRYGRITASKFHEAAHCLTKEGVLVETILGAYKMDENAAIARGKKLEGAVQHVVEKKLCVKISKCGLFLRSDYPILGASPDGVDSDHIYEFKCPINMNNFSKYFMTCGGKNIPAKKHLAQMQLQMLMTGMMKGYFCVARPDFEESCEVDIVEVEYDEALCHHLISKSFKFWEENVFPVMYRSLF